MKEVPAVTEDSGALRFLVAEGFAGGCGARNDSCARLAEGSSEKSGCCVEGGGESVVVGVFGARLVEDLRL